MENKKTKLEILASLLKRDKISTDEFLILLETQKEYIYFNNYRQPYTYVDTPIISPYTVTCTTEGNGSISTTGVITDTSTLYNNTCNCLAQFDSCTCNYLS